jgi:LmbE family N-acetylglucosaminyl deacetylase
MAEKLKALLCIAHPDDEVIFFGGLLQQRKYDWTVACATDANADGKGKRRLKDFHRSCKMLGVRETVCFGLPDVFSRRLNQTKLIQCIRSLGSFNRVYTHGVLGEYGHRHHQDVSFAVHQTFQGRTSVFSAAYNTYADEFCQLTRSQFKMKTKILQEIYSGESNRFLNFLPATHSEAFVRVSLLEVTAIYQYICKKRPIRNHDLRVYSWLYDYLKNRDFELKSRPF